MRRAVPLALFLLLFSGSAGAYEPSPMLTENLHFTQIDLGSPSIAPNPSSNPVIDEETDSSPIKRVITPIPSAPVHAEAKSRHAPPMRFHAGSVRGVATWYCQPGVSVCTRGFGAGGAYGAAGPALRKALGNWRGRTVYVNGIAVKLIDWCACGGNHVIDVYHATWLRIPHPNSVIIRW